MYTFPFYICNIQNCPVGRITVHCPIDLCLLFCIFNSLWPLLKYNFFPNSQKTLITSTECSSGYLYFKSKIKKMKFFSIPERRQFHFDCYLVLPEILAQEFKYTWKNLTVCWGSAELLQSHLTLCDPMDCNLPGCSVHGILQALILPWIFMPSSRGSSQPRDWNPVSYISFIGRQVLHHKHHLALC